LYKKLKYENSKIIEKKQITTIALIGLILFIGTVSVTVPVQSSLSQQSMEGNASEIIALFEPNQTTQSIPENMASNLDIIKESKSFGVVPGKEIQPIPNSFIIKLKPSEEGTFDTSSFEASIAPELEGSTANITSTLGEIGYLTLQFGEEQQSTADESTAGSNISTSLSAADQQVLDRIKQNPAVEKVFNDARVTIQAQVLPNDVNRVDADMSPARSGDGAGSVDADIGILDTGVQFDHPDLNVFKCVSFVANPTPGTPLPTCGDGQGHGTHVAGTAAAKDNNVGVVGKAPGARIWAIKVLDDSGSGSFSDILEGLNYVAQNANQIDVINLSLGGIGSFPPAEDAITKLVEDKGVVVVLAAGNSNMNAIGFTPAKTPAAITVSAMVDTDGKCGAVGIPHARVIVMPPPTPPFAVSYGNDDSFAAFSNHGSIVDMAAPGVDVLSTYKGSSYATLSGTSMAAPNVAGAATLLKSIYSTATPKAIELLLEDEATHDTDPPVGHSVCNSDGKGYFDSTNDDDNEREALLYMK
jgi:subtilisin family serine protease